MNTENGESRVEYQQRRKAKARVESLDATVLSERLASCDKKTERARKGNKSGKQFGSIRLREQQRLWVAEMIERWYFGWCRQGEGLSGTSTSSVAIIEWRSKCTIA